jgi:hypothetical protein
MVVGHCFRSQNIKGKNNRLNIMSDLHIDVTPTSVDNGQRAELLWEKREEILLLKWCDDCIKKSKLHEIRGKQNKIKYGVFAVPAILIPIILGGLSQVMPCHSLGYSLGIMSAGLFGGINAFFNFGNKMQLHFEYANRFAELAIDIQAELAKPKRHRVACDFYLGQSKLKYQNLCSESPNF